MPRRVSIGYQEFEDIIDTDNEYDREFFFYNT